MIFTILAWLGIAAAVHTMIIKWNAPPQVGVIMRSNTIYHMIFGGVLGSIIGPIIQSMFGGTGQEIAEVFILGWLPAAFIGRWMVWAGYQNRIDVSIATEELKRPIQQPFDVSKLKPWTPDDAEEFEEYESQSNNDFGFDESIFSTPKKEAPRGFNERHPDDVKLWAYVDDPNASDQEIKTAMDKILARRRKRAGKSNSALLTDERARK